jgi:type IV pilus assembly protein PilM
MREDTLAPLSLGGSSAVVGLDIGTDHIRAAQLKQTGHGHTVASYGRVPVPLGAVVDGEIVDVDAVAGAIAQLWKRSGFRSKDVSVGVSNQKVVVRLIDLPYMERSELAGAIEFQAQDYIPIPVEEAVVDFQIIGDYMTPGDEHMMEVLLVAAHKDMINGVVQTLERAKLRPEQIDVTAFALIRALLGSQAALLADESEEPGTATGIIHVSSGITNIVVAERGIPRFVRVSGIAGNQFTQAIANALNLTFDEAEELKFRAGLPPLEGEAQPTDDPQVQAAREALEREVNKFVAEVRRSLDYYLTQSGQPKTISRLLLTGSGAMLANLPAYLEKGLQMQVLYGDPMAFVQTTSASEQETLADRMGSAPAIGLAMGGIA